MKRLIVLSGGLDSAVTLFDALEFGGEAENHVFRVDSGSRQAEKESQAFHLLADAAGIPENARYESSLSMPWLDDHDLYNPGVVAVNATAAGATQGPINNQPTWVPARNLVFLSLAVSCAVAVGATEVWVGFDWMPTHSKFSDKSPTFLRNLGGCVSGIIEKDAPLIVAPLNGHTKAEIVTRGSLLKVPFEKTWSCYNAFPLPCGQCASCVARMQGFVEAGVNDPLQYMPLSVIDQYVITPFV